MRVQILLSICLLIASCCYSQDTSTAHSERLIIEQQDTFVAIPYIRAKILFASIADLSERIRLDNISMAIKDSTIASLKLSKRELSEALDKRENIISNQILQIENLNQVNRNTKKIWLRRVLYGSCGGLAAGVVAGVLIK